MKSSVEDILLRVREERLNVSSLLELPDETPQRPVTGWRRTDPATESKVFTLHAQGLSQGRIAAELGMHQRTVGRILARPDAPPAPRSPELAAKAKALRAEGLLVSAIARKLHTTELRVSQMLAVPEGRR